MKKTTIRGGVGTVLTLAATLALAGGAQAQEATQNWFAYLGCWSPESNSGPSLCIRPTLEGVELVRIADEQIVSREALSTRPEGLQSSREGCQGEHEAAFSDDGRRLFFTSDYACEGGGTRHESGILTLLSSDVLLDVRSVDVEGEPVAWVQSYRAASAALGQDVGIADLPLPGMALETARRAAAASIGTDDVVEALDAVGPGAVEAWVAETGDRFDLDAETLVALSDHGVPEAVIDLMIAVSYPDRFALAVDDGPPSAERLSAAYSGYRPVLSARGATGCYGYADPFFYDPYGYGCGYGYRYSRYSYGPYGYNRGWYGYYNPGVVYVGGTNNGASNNNGRVVRGRGYTRGGTGSTSTGSGTSTSAGSTRTAPPASAGSGSAGTTRRAKPRGGGGGGGGGLF